jgi:hypothetical protein
VVVQWTTYAIETALKILFFSTVHPSAVAPTRGTFNKVLLEALRAAGHDIRVIVPVAWHERNVRDDWHDPHATTVRFWYPPRVFRGSLHRFLWISVRGVVKRVTRGWRPDVVLGYWTHPDGTVALKIADRIDVAGCVIVGGTDVNILAAEPNRRAMITATLTKADRVITIGG